MSIKCTECKKSITDPVEPRWESWMRLMNFLEIQNLQGEISDDLFTTLADDLMWFKPIGDDEDDEKETSE